MREEVRETVLVRSLGEQGKQETPGINGKQNMILQRISEDNTAFFWDEG